jgi:hypothetical protein
MAEENLLTRIKNILTRPNGSNGHTYRTSPLEQATDILTTVKNAHPDVYYAIPAAMTAMQEAERISRNTTDASTDFLIEELSDTYRIRGVLLDNEYYVVELVKELLDGGERHTQEGWVEYTQTTELKIPSAKMYNAFIFTLYANKDHKDAVQKHLVEKVKGVLKQDFAAHYMMTSTRVAYQKTGKDRVTHDYGMLKPQQVDEDIVGPYAWINAASGVEKPVKTILGTDKLEEVEHAYEWLSGRKPYFWRFNIKPSKEEERAVVFGLVDDYSRFDIDAYAFNIDYGMPARGVVAQKILRNAQ